MKTALTLAVLQLVAVSAFKLPEPTRPLEWKDVNFLSTSDTHGWLLGHQHATWPEPNYSGDYGSFASFATHMRAIADEKGVDLLLVDAGDHHDGSGLVSSSPESAGEADEIFSMLPYDVMTIGNHELYHYADALELYRHQRRWKGRYVTSNVNITVEDEHGVWQSVPIGKQYLKFETKQGRRVTAFGVIFNFAAHDPGVTVQKPSKLAKEAWFLDAIAEAPNYFVLAGHMPARGETAEWAPIFEAIRNIHPTVPIYVFGGHTHVRDCVQYDDWSIAIVPGRYLETIAFTSSSLPANSSDTRRLDVARRYIDANPVSYKWHVGVQDDFELPIGKDISLALLRLSSDLNISAPLGKAPHDFFLARYPYGHPNSVLTEAAEKVLPFTIQDQERDGPRIIVGNAGSFRFDLFQGHFDRNDELTISPFTTAFLYIPLKASLARNITEQMNRSGASKLLPSAPQTKGEEDQRVRTVYERWLSDQWYQYLAEQALLSSENGQIAWSANKDSRKGEELTLGFVTRDACPGKGDDIEHIPVPFAGNQPDFISTPFPDVDDDEVIDVVCMDFALDDFLVAVNTLDPTVGLKAGDMKPYAEGVLINAILGMYAQAKW